MGTFGITIRDHSGEVSSSNFNIGPVTAATLPGLLSDTGALESAIAAISIGVVARDRMSVFDNAKSGDLPTSPFAQRELKFMVRYRDVTEYFDAPTNSIPNEGYGRLHTVEIACPKLDLTGLFVGATDEVDLAQTQIAAFVSAFEGVVLSPANGSVEVVSIEVVGRRL